MTLRSWSDVVPDGQTGTSAERLPPAKRVGGPWSLLANLERFSSELLASENLLEPHLHEELRCTIGDTAQNLRARGKTEIADALTRAESALGRIAAVGAVRRAELAELDRISRELPSLLFAESTRTSNLPQRAGQPLARVRVRATSSASGANRPLAGRTAVIVNEDREIAWSQNGVLHDAGARVQLAYDGHDALEMCRKVVPDVILVDAFMSGLDGIAIARAVRRHALLRDMGIVLVGGRRGLLERLAKLGAGADGYLLDKADAPSIQKCVADAIQARSTLETDLSSPNEVHGSLALVAPRTLLVTTARLRPDATVKLQHGSDAYEATLRGGALVGVALSERATIPSNGRAALRKCLGLRHGDFWVGGSVMRW